MFYLFSLTFQGSNVSKYTHAKDPQKEKSDQQLNISLCTISIHVYLLYLYFEMIFIGDIMY